MYYIKVNWYNDYEESDQITHMFTIAKNFNDAMQNVTDTFDYINSVEIQEIYCGNDCKCIYVPEELVDAIIKENEI